MYIISDIVTDTSSEGEDNLLPLIPELPTCELSREIIIEKRVSELEKIAEQDPTSIIRLQKCIATIGNLFKYIYICINYIITNQSIFMYIISDTNTDLASKGEDYLVPPIPELPTCEPYSQPPSHERLLKSVYLN